jgi:hypothetical protein
VYSFDLPARIDRAKAPNLAVQADRPHYGAVNLATPGILGRGAEADHVVGERRGVREAEPDVVELPQLVLADCRQLVGVDHQVLAQRSREITQLELGDRVRRLALVRPVEEPEPAGDDRGALDVDAAVKALSHCVIHGLKVHHSGLALERSVRRKRPEEPAIALAVRSRAQPQQASVRLALHRRQRRQALEIGLLVLAAVGIGWQFPFEDSPRLARRASRQLEDAHLEQVVADDVHEVAALRDAGRRRNARRLALSGWLLQIEVAKPPQLERREVLVRGLDLRHRQPVPDSAGAKARRRRLAVSPRLARSVVGADEVNADCELLGSHDSQRRVVHGAVEPAKARVSVIVGEKPGGAVVPPPADLHAHPRVGLDVLYVVSRVAVFGDDPKGGVPKTVPNRGAPRLARRPPSRLEQRLRPGPESGRDQRPDHRVHEPVRDEPCDRTFCLFSASGVHL